MSGLDLGLLSERVLVGLLALGGVFWLAVSWIFLMGDHEYELAPLVRALMQLTVVVVVVAVVLFVAWVIGSFFV